MTQTRIQRPINKPEPKNTPVTIVSLGRYPDLFEGLHQNIKFYGEEEYTRIFVRDGVLIDYSPAWKLVDGPEEFSYAKNLNVGLRMVDPDHDVFVICDDVRLTGAHSIETLRKIANSDDRIGMLSPWVNGAADNPDQTTNRGSLVFSNRYLAMACFYLKRKVINTIGYLDEEVFSGGYGWDDVDYCRRIHDAGFKLAVTYDVKVKHGIRKNGNGTESYLRNARGYDSVLKAQIENNEKLYAQKWHDNKKQDW